MRPPILKAWNRTAIQFRGIYSNRYGIGSQTGGSSGGGSGGEISVVQGDNFEFNFDGDITRFYLKDDFGDNYLIDIVDVAGDYQIEIAAAAGGLPSSAPPPVFAGNYVFCIDAYLRFHIDGSGGINSSYIAVNSDGSATPVIEDPAVANTAIKSTTTYKVGSNFEIVGTKFYFKDMLGNVYYPIIVEDTPGNYVLQLTAGYL
jgi:hypothetical protein